MSEQPVDHQPHPGESGEFLQSIRLLQVAHSAGRDAFADLSEAVMEEGTLERMFQEGCLSGFGNPRALLIDGAGVEVYRAMKDRAKALLAVEILDLYSRREGMLGYCLAVAGALAHHRRSISALPMETIETMMLALCSASDLEIGALAERAMRIAGART